MTQLVATPGSVRITRVTMPRYEVEYRDPQTALVHAAGIRDQKGLVLEEVLKIGIGQEVVLDFLIRDRPLRATLLFRLVQVSGQTHILEWWSRRSTDPEMLEIWIAGLEGKPHDASTSNPFPAEYAFAETAGTQESTLVPSDLSRQERDEILSLCRRLMLHNPFAALGIHWTAIPKEQKDAAETAKQALTQAAEKCLGDEKMNQFISKAKLAIANVLKQLKTVQQRRTVRERFVPREQLESSLQLVKHQLEMAQFRGETQELPRLKIMIDELSGGLETP
jgi:hypothetical protein